MSVAYWLDTPLQQHKKGGDSKQVSRELQKFVGGSMPVGSPRPLGEEDIK